MNYFRFCCDIYANIETNIETQPNVLSVPLSVRPSVRTSFRLAKSPLGPKCPSPPQELEKSSRRGDELSSRYISLVTHLKKNYLNA